MKSRLEIAGFFFTSDNNANPSDLTKFNLSKLKIKQGLFFNYKTLKIEARIEKIILTIYKNDVFDRFLENKELFEIRF